MEQGAGPMLELVGKTVFWPVVRVEVWCGGLLKMDTVYGIGWKNATSKGVRRLLHHAVHLGKLKEDQ